MIRPLLLCLLLPSLSSFAADKAVEVFVDRGDYFLRAGSRAGLQVGSEVTFLGEKIADTEERRTAGQGTVMEVWDSLARVRPDDPAAMASIRFARLPKAVAAAPKPARAQAPAAPAAQAPSGGKAVESSSGFSDRLVGTCAGARVEVVARSGLIGGSVRLVVDGKVLDAGDVKVGQNVQLGGVIRGKPAVLRITQGLFGTDYELTRDGASCPLEDVG